MDLQIECWPLAEGSKTFRVGQFIVPKGSLQGAGAVLEFPHVGFGNRVGTSAPLEVFQNVTRDKAKSDIAEWQQRHPLSDG